MRNMSFMLTTAQILDHSKTVTRRLGWWNLKPGEVVMACEKCQGLGKGGKIRQLTGIEIVSSRGEPLEQITKADVIAEGFPDLTTWEFVALFCEHMGCKPATIVNRIQFEYVVTF